jgi:hypothetical protein
VHFFDFLLEELDLVRVNARVAKQQLPIQAQSVPASWIFSRALCGMPSPKTTEFFWSKEQARPYERFCSGSTMALNEVS